jgi:hypothetical protein
MLLEKVVQLLIVAAFVATAHAVAGGGGVSITTERYGDDAVMVTVAVERVDGCGVSIQVRALRELDAEDPSVPTYRPLDLRGALSRSTTIAPSTSGSWKMVDADDSTRVYTAILSTAALRQQFVDSGANIAAVGAVSGGSAGAVVSAVVFRRVMSRDAASAMTVEVVASAKHEIWTGASKVDLRAVVLRPVVASATTVRLAVETRTTQACSEAGAPPALTVNGAASCDEVSSTASTCPACVQRMVVERPLSSDAKNEFTIALTEGTTGTTFSIKFAVPKTALCKEGATGCVLPDYTKLAGTGRAEPDETPTSHSKPAPEVRLPQQDDEAVPQPAHVSPVHGVGSEIVVASPDAPVTVAFTGAAAGNNDGVVTVTHGKQTCIEAYGAGEEYGADRRPVEIEYMRIVSAESGKTYVVVTDGAVDDQFARFAGARMVRRSNGRCAVCFSLSLGEPAFDILIGWKSDPATDAPQTDDRAVPSWCSRSATCFGEIAVRATSVRGGTGLPMHNTEHNHHEHEHEHEHDGHHRGESGVLWVIVLALAAIAIPGVVAAALFCMTNHQNAD